MLRQRHQLDYDLVSDDPAELFMGELPQDWGEIPARIVVNLCGMYPAGDPLGRVVFSLPMLDVMEDELVPDQDLFEAFLDAVHGLAAEEPSYWHCHAGINRSGMLVAGYLHRHRGLSISKAIATLRAQRSEMVLCNTIFERTLRTWYGGPDEQHFEPFSLDSYLDGRRRTRRG